MGTVQPVLAWIKMDVKPLMMMMMMMHTRPKSLATAINGHLSELQ